MSRVAIVTHDDALATRFRRALLAAGHQVVLVTAADAAGLATIAKERSEILLVDAALPAPNGTPLARRLRAEDGLARAPIVAIVGDAALPALDLRTGLDDFLLASCSPEELEARLRAALGRAGQPEAGEAVLRRGELAIDHTKYEVCVRGVPVDLTYKEYELLRFLALQPGRVFTRDALLTHIWGYDYYGGSRTVDVHIRRLRSKLAIGEADVIRTVRGVGYKFAEDRPSPEGRPGGGRGAARHPRRTR